MVLPVRPRVYQRSSAHTAPLLPGLDRLHRLPDHLLRLPLPMHHPPLLTQPLPPHLATLRRRLHTRPLDLNHPKPDLVRRRERAEWRLPRPKLAAGCLGGWSGLGGWGNWGVEEGGEVGERRGGGGGGEGGEADREAGREVGGLSSELEASAVAWYVVWKRSEGRWRTGCLLD